MKFNKTFAVAFIAMGCIAAMTSCSGSSDKNDADTDSVTTAIVNGDEVDIVTINGDSATVQEADIVDEVVNVPADAAVAVD